MSIDRRPVIDFVKHNRLCWILESIDRIRRRQKELCNDAIRLHEFERDEIDYIKGEINLMIRQFKRL